MKVLVADANALIRCGLKHLILEQDKKSAVLEAESYDEAEEYEDEDIDLLWLDLQLPGMERFAGLENLREVFPEVPIAVTSASLANRRDVLRAIELGAQGIVPERAPCDEILDNLKRIKEGEIVVMDSANMDWFDVEDPENGSPMDFERGGTPVPGLFIKLLYRDPETGFYTRLIKAKPGWREHPLAHHPVFEEAYCLEGEFDYNFGFMTPGHYFFRPAGVRHGDFTAGEQEGCTWILRCDGDLVDWYTENASVEMKGDPVNWGEDFPGTEPPVYIQPVRSRSIGLWDNPSYQ